MVVHKLEARCSWLARAEGGITTRANGLVPFAPGFGVLGYPLFPAKTPIVLILKRRCVP